MNTQLMVKKSNELVTARFSFSLMEMRLFTMIVSLIDDRDDDFKQYQIPVKDIISIYGITSKTVYAQVVTLSKSMLKKIITIPLKENEIDKEIQTTLFSSFKYAINGT